MRTVTKMVIELVLIFIFLGMTHPQTYDRALLGPNRNIEVNVKSYVSKVNKEDISIVKTVLDKIVKFNKNAEPSTPRQRRRKNFVEKLRHLHDVVHPVNFSRLDMRVGKILKAFTHPNADNLYVETIDVGETSPRIVVSGLARFMPLEELTNRKVVLLCNILPCKLRGVLSMAMILCAGSRNKEQVEILEPPPESLPGDFIHVNGYARNPDKILKVFNEVIKDLRTNDNLQATYRGIPWIVMDAKEAEKGAWRTPKKGYVMTKSLKNVSIY